MSPAAARASIVYVEAAANPVCSVLTASRPPRSETKETAGGHPLYRLARADITVFQPEVWELVQDLEVLGQLAAELPR